MPTFGGAYASYSGRDSRCQSTAVRASGRDIVLAERVNGADPAPKPSLSLLCRRQREYETLGAGVIANRLVMGRVTVDRPVGKMAA
jgi:hypothetical protein